MFDELKCDYPLPDAVVQEATFQTKSLECIMDSYTITQDGRLVLHRVRYEMVPEEARPFYGTPEWEGSGLLQLIGSLKAVPMGDEEVPYHGDVTFYTSTGTWEAADYEWFEYQARFTEGRLQWIKRVETHYGRGRG